VLCRYGIEYVEDPRTHERVPTCHRAQYAPILTDADYLAALENAPDGYTRGLYEAEARKINEIQKGILAISSHEEPFDVFICYKETTDGGSRTKDSVLAQDIYYQLHNDGYRVFFAKITLEDKLGQEYEPYIFAALNSAKVMLVVGTQKEYFNAVWVRNEWSRFLTLMKGDRSRLLIPCYRDMDAYDMPEEFSHLQAQDMGKIGFIQDITRGVKKVLDADKKRDSHATSASVAGAATSGADALLKRAYIFLEDKDFNQAREYFNRVLDADPENARAYLGLLCAEMKTPHEKDLATIDSPLSDNVHFKNALRFADTGLKAELQGYEQANREIHRAKEAKRIEEEKKAQESLREQQRQAEEEENELLRKKSGKIRLRITLLVLVELVVLIILLVSVGEAFSNGSIMQVVNAAITPLVGLVVAFALLTYSKSNVRYHNLRQAAHKANKIIFSIMVAILGIMFATAIDELVIGVAFVILSVYLFIKALRNKHRTMDFLSIFVPKVLTKLLTKAAVIVIFAISGLSLFLLTTPFFSLPYNTYTGNDVLSMTLRRGASQGFQYLPLTVLITAILLIALTIIALVRKKPVLKSIMSGAVINCLLLNGMHISYVQYSSYDTWDTSHVGWGMDMVVFLSTVLLAAVVIGRAAEVKTEKLDSLAKEEPNEKIQAMMDKYGERVNSYSGMEQATKRAKTLIFISTGLVLLLLLYAIFLDHSPLSVRKLLWFATAFLPSVGLFIKKPGIYNYILIAALANIVLLVFGVFSNFSAIIYFISNSFFSALGFLLIMLVEIVVSIILLCAALIGRAAQGKLINIASLTDTSAITAATVTATSIVSQPTSAHICDSCGTLIKSEQKFCVSCGASTGLI
jgi:tetratricopeptide (TPR) repeat protein